MYGDKCSLSHLECGPSPLGYKTWCHTEDVRSVPLSISHALLGQTLHYNFPPYNNFTNASSTVLKVGVSTPGGGMKWDVTDLLTSWCIIPDQNLPVTQPVEKRSRIFGTVLHKWLQHDPVLNQLNQSSTL